MNCRDFEKTFRSIFIKSLIWHFPAALKLCCDLAMGPILPIQWYVLVKWQYVQLDSQKVFGDRGLKNYVRSLAVLSMRIPANIHILSLHSFRAIPLYVQYRCRLKNTAPNHIEFALSIPRCTRILSIMPCVFSLIDLHLSQHYAFSERFFSNNESYQCDVYLREIL